MGKGFKGRVRQGYSNYPLLSKDFSIEYFSLSSTIRVPPSNEDAMGEIFHYTHELPNPTILSDFNDDTNIEFPLPGDTINILY